MYDITLKSIEAVRDGLKEALDRVCSPGFRQIQTADVLLTEISKARDGLEEILRNNEK